MQERARMLRSFHAAVRAFGKKGWFKRMWTVRAAADSLGGAGRRHQAAAGVASRCLPARDG